MLIRMLVQMPPGSARNGLPWPDKGAVEEIPDGEAWHLVASGIAEDVTDEADADAGRPARRSRKKEAEG